MVPYYRFLVSMKTMKNEEYMVSTSIRHKGERKRQREDDLAQFLRDHLPERYRIGTGEIFMSLDDSVSSQYDIIVYGRLNMQVIGKKTFVQQVAIEGVYSLLEVKSGLDNSAHRD